MSARRSNVIACFALILMILPSATAWATSPSPVYETSVPGYTIPHARDVVVDEAGNAYLIGSAYQDGTHLDVLVAKFDIAGDLVWTQYIAGNGHCFATGIALDSAQNVWVTGWTDASDWPIVNGMDDTLTGFRDVFLMNLAASDGAIHYSTYLGGDYTDAAQGIVLNADDEIYLTGYTGSTDFPVTANALQPEPSFPLYFYEDSFVTKLAPTGDVILYSTYFGGTQDDQAQMIGLDGAGNIVIAGTTTADDFPLVSALQSTPDDMFIAKLSADGSALLFSTYFGGEDLDRPGRMVLDDAGSLYLVGSTRSEGFPTTPGAYAEELVGAVNGCEVPFGQDHNCEDIYVTKLATDGSGIIWSTYLGGTRVDEGRAIAVDGAGRVYVAGYTSSADFPPLGMDFGAEIIVCRLDATGSTLDFTYSLDSGSANRGNGITVDSRGDVYFTGTVGVPASVFISKLGFEVFAAAVDLTPVALQLARNYPNPFNPSTTISFSVPAAERVTLQVFDLAGRLVRTLVGNETVAAGTHERRWDGSDSQGRSVSSGVYLYRLRAGDDVQAKRMMLTK